MFEKFGAEFAQLATAALGGLISIMLRKETRGWGDVVWGVAGSAFCGKSVAWLCAGVGVNSDLTMFFVSLAGWIGANESMRFFEKQVKARLSAKDDSGGDTN